MTTPESSDSQFGERHVVIIGAGPAGLTAAYKLSEVGLAATVLESDSVVGGISRTVERDGWRFDIGGHRFFTKVGRVEDVWFEILGSENFLRRPRQSRIFYKGKLYDYPLVPLNALRNLGALEAVRCVGSYVWVRVRPPRDRSTLEGFIASRFGWRLYRHFFKTYSEKVWGVPASELSADWGAQRVKDLSLWRSMRDALTPRRARVRRDRSKQVTSLIEEFNYPKYGPGMMWESAARIVTSRGVPVKFHQGVTRIHHGEGRVHEVVAVDLQGNEATYPCTEVISSMPIGSLLLAMEPSVPDDVREAALGLLHRDFLTVALVVPEAYSFSDNWIYIHDPDVLVGRIQNYGSWSPYLVKNGRTCLGLEYFVNEGDALWEKPDAELVELATDELHRLGLADASRVETGYVVRMPKAYPVYDECYQRNVDILREWLGRCASNVFPVGRNGMHKYNNQDHSMFTAMLSVENICGAYHDVWSVNVEAEYHEEGSGTSTPSAGREAPLTPRSALHKAATSGRPVRVNMVLESAESGDDLE